MAEDDPDALSDTWHAARDKGPAWRLALETALARLPESNRILAALPR
jgi:hypothetical protein